MPILLFPSRLAKLFRGDRSAGESGAINRLEIPRGILGKALELADDADGLGIERWRLEWPVRVVLYADRQVRAGFLVPARN